MTHRRAGFTIIELLVVIGIISVLLALLLPAVQQAREAGRQTQCRNNLKQLGLALHAYHDQHRTFPPGPNPVFTRSQWPWSVMILPYVDQRPLYDSFDFANGRASDVVAYPGLAVRVLPVYDCPTEPGPRLEPLSQLTSSQLARMAYLGVSGSCRAPTAHANGVIPQGSAGVISHVRISEILDGTSQTLLLGEGSSKVATLRSYPWNPRHDGLAFWFGFHIYYSSGFTVSPSFVTRSTCHPPNGGPFRWFSSFHTGGAHFLLADGAVRFVSSNVNPAVFQDAGSRAGGEVPQEW